MASIGHPIRPAYHIYSLEQGINVFVVIHLFDDITRLIPFLTLIDVLDGIIGGSWTLKSISKMRWSGRDGSAILAFVILPVEVGAECREHQHKDKWHLPSNVHCGTNVSVKHAIKLWTYKSDP